MWHNTLKFALALALLGIFSPLGSISKAQAGISYKECENLIKGGRLRFDRNRTMPAGRFRGRPLSAGTPSPALRVLTPEETFILDQRVPENHYSVGNFVSRYGIAIAAVPMVAPKNISILKEDEVDGTWHLMIRLVYPKKHKIKFWPQTLDGILGEPYETNDIVIDFGTHRVEGEEQRTYTALRGLTGHYALQSRMGSTWFKVRRIQRDGRKVVEFPLRMSKDRKRDLMQRFLKRTEEINRGEMYHSVVRNCATEFNVLFKAVGGESCWEAGLLKGIIHGAVSWVPSGLLWSLRRQKFDFDGVEQEIIIAPDDEL